MEDLEAYLENMNNDIYDLYSKCKHINFELFEYTDKDLYFDCDIDPEKHFYNKIINDCQYYLDDQFTTKVEKMVLV